MRGGETPVGSMMKLGIVVKPLNVMNRANFHLNLVASLQRRGGQTRRFAFGMHLALTTLPCTPRWQVISRPPLRESHVG
jgi:hypothetical protein